MNPGKLVNLGIFVHTLVQDRVSERERETKAMYIEDERQVLEKACFVN